ncbi:hypothetical protein [Alkalilacustris brevis]|uniref:hypothetical protein n=1 Tax=Alkalilacustris brevis TaxID=2026338 RepID=UPI001EE47872|nr:hypothetical protein [Alkalilacustris brevis]
MRDQRQMGEGRARQVQRRRVFYIPGYDPFPPRRYRELYRSEAARQAAISGHEIRIAAKSGKDGPYGWHVTARIEGGETETDVAILIWADIVRDSMRRGVLATYLLLARTFWIYLSTGVMGRLFRLRRGPVITAMYPVVMLLGQLGLALLAAALVGRGLAWLAAPQGAGLAPWLPWWPARLAGLAVVPPVLWWFRALDRRFYAHYLLHDFAFTAQHYGESPPALEARMSEFARQVSVALDSEVDEVLVVGHSSGAHLGVSVLADVLRARGGRPGRAALGFLTLGQAVPMQSFLPRATRLREDLHYLAQSEALAWIDVSAPGDGCCYALCDPVSVSGVAPAGKRWPLVISAAFSQTLRPETWARLKRRYFRLHFQYLCAFDNPGDYDYFAITAGPCTLAERFAGRRPSSSRKEAVLSPHTTREATA